MPRWSIVTGALVMTWVMLAGASITAQNIGGSPEARKVKNPVPPTAVSIEKGKQLFAKNCQFCHGEAGHGDGPLIPKGMQPANLSDGKWDRGSTDGEIFLVIKEGAGPKFDMKGFKSKMTDQEIWNVVNYLRSLQAK